MMRTAQISKIFRHATAIFVFLLTIAFTTAAVAQLSGKGSIRGTVLDQSGAVVPHATVTAINKGTNVKTVRESTSSGDYELSSLDPGDYVVTVTAQGFQGYKQANAHVNALEVVNLEVKLTVGASSETVTVTEAPPSLETTNATLGATMEQSMYAALPLEMGAAGSPDQRRATDFVALMPGVQSNETNGNATTNVGVINGSGSRGAAASVYINGIPFTSVAGEGDTRFVWTAISVDAVDQFQLQTTGSPAMYEGQGVLNFSIKSGNNKYHGSVYDYIRNTAFDAWGFFAPALINPYTETTPGVLSTGHATKPTQHMNEFGIVLSGPIIRDRLFYFGNYGGFRFSQGPKPTFQTQPTAAMRTGDFTGVGVNIYDPRTTTCVGSACTRLQFGPLNTANPSTANNIIPLSAQSTVARNLQAFIPPNTNTALTNNYLAGYKAGLTNWMTTHRVDYTVSSNNQLSLIVAQGRQASTVPTSQTTAGRNVGPIPVNYGQAYAPKTTVIILQDAYTITPHIVNQLNYGFSRYNGPTFNADRGAAYGVAANGYGNLPAGQAQDSFPIVSFTGVDAPTSLAGVTASVNIANSYTFIDNVQWTKGKHLITIGAQVAWMQYQNLTATTGTTPLTIANNITETSAFTAGASTTVTSTGIPYASFLTGAPDSVTATQNFVAENGARFRPISPYIQDTWRATKKLTVDAGLRWDYFPTYREEHDRLSFLNPTGANSLSGNLGTVQFAGNSVTNDSCNCRTPINDYYKNFGPRVGVAYALNPKTVLRASYGVMFTHGNGVGGGTNSRTGTGTLGYSASPKISWVQTSAYSAATNPVLDAGFPTSPTTPYFSTNLAPTVGTGYYIGGPSGQGVSYGDTYLGGRAPEYVNWSAGFQREITHNLTLTASYVGSEGHFVQEDTANGRGQYINQLNPVFLAAGATLSAKATVANVATAVAAAGVAAPNYNSATFDPTQTVAQALKAFPQYSGVSDTYGYYANTNYHGMQLSLVRRESRGLSYMVNYTYSKSIDNGGTFRSGYDIPARYTYSGTTMNHFRAERSESTSSQRQHLAMTGVWALPIGKGRLGGGNVYTRNILSGFKFSSTFVAYSGSPLALTAASAQCGTNASQGTCLPTLNPAFTGPARINGSWGQGVTAADVSKRFIDPTAFVTTSQSTAATPYYANAPRTAPYKIFGPGNYNWDISLRRVFPLHLYSSKLTIEGDLYNVTNHTQFTVNSSTTSYQGATSAGTFGQIIGQTNNQRQAQFSARIEF
ncbi:MAG: TonB-dependent receptor [Acidobacteriaceae bacterium]|nr:TonB-dependent receptor [Acidobacteriaceae bacterium]